jgi:branched-chain amino acid aminotransferase
MQGTNRFAYFEGAIVPIEQARVSIMTPALNYGTGVFEGVRAFWCEPDGPLLVFRLHEHMRRFLRNARALLIDLPLSVDEACAIVLDLLTAEGYRADSYIRPLAYKSGTAVGVKLHGVPGAMSAFAIPFGAYLDRPGGARLMTSTWRRPSDDALPARHKMVGTYVNSALAKSEAVLAGFDDALMLTAGGHVSESSGANIFVVRDGRLLTPPVYDDVLEGITRDTVLALARDHGIDTVERSLDRTELYIADEAFLCGTAMNVMPVVELDHRRIGDGAIGPITTRLTDLYDRAVHGQIEAYRAWCTAVPHAHEVSVAVAAG